MHFKFITQINFPFLEIIFINPLDKRSQKVYNIPTMYF